MNFRVVFVVLVSLLLPSVARAEMKSVRVREANFRAGPSTSDDIKFSAGLYYPVKIVEKKRGWCKIRDFEGDKAWVAARLLSSRRTLVVKVRRGNVREKPTTKSDVAFKVERGEAYKILDREGRWLKVTDESTGTGWIREDLAWGMLKKPSSS